MKFQEKYFSRKSESERKSSENALRKYTEQDDKTDFQAGIPNRFHTDSIITVACAISRKWADNEKALKSQLFHLIGTQCVIGVQLVRAKARRKLMHLSLRLVFTWNRIYKGNISFVKGLKQLNNS